MTRYIDLTAHIVRAYTANNTLPAAALPDLIAQVHGALLRTADASGSEPPAPAPARAKPRKTVFPGYIVSLEDGKRYKSLRRHLGKFGLTPEEYRAKWNLLPTYPMVCEEYSKERSTLALKMGLGRDKGSKVITLRGKRALARPAKSETPATGKKAPTRK